jgi:hypothetical protein
MRLISLLLAVTSVTIEALALTHVIQAGYVLGGYFVMMFAYFLLFAGTLSEGVF